MASALGQAMSELRVDAEEPTCFLLDLSHDLLSIVTHELYDPLQPLLFVHLSSTAKGLRAATEKQLAELKQHRQQVEEMVAGLHIRCAQLRDATKLHLGAGYNRPLTLAHWMAFGNLARSGSLPRLELLSISGTDIGIVALLAAVLRRGRLPSLRHLVISNAQINPRAATALATALTSPVVPLLMDLSLSINPVGGAGLTALAPALRQLPELRTLYLNQNQITDQGLASLLASPTAGVLPSLTFLNLNGNQITDEGCATLAVALRSGALPALRVLNLSNNPASRQEAQMVKAARPSVHFVFLGPGGAAT